MVANYLNSSDAKKHHKEDGCVSEDIQMVVKGAMCTLYQATACHTAKAILGSDTKVSIMISDPRRAEGLYATMSAVAARGIAASLIHLADSIDAGKVAA